MQRIRPRYLPPLPEEPIDSGQAVLRDGTVAVLRLAQPSDSEAFEAFVARLSPESRRHRFFSESAPPADVLRPLCASSDPRQRMTLIALRDQNGVPRIIGSGSYFARDATSAEVAFAVDDSLRGHGLGTILLERLALLAVRHGFTRLWAVTHADNLAMRDVFEASGFAVQGGQAQIGEILLANFQNEWQIFGADGLPFLADSYEDSMKLYMAQKPMME